MRRLGVAVVDCVLGAFGLFASVGFLETGTMKEDAYRGLCRMPDGEIRHYGLDVATGRRVYVASRDEGRSWAEHQAATAWEDAMVRCPWSGTWVTLRSRDFGRRSLVIRSKAGPGDPASVTNEVSLAGFVFNRQPVPIAGRKRLLCPGNFQENGEKGSFEYFGAVAVSDDDGVSWRLSVARPNVKRGGVVPPDRMRRWENYCCEPTVLEMRDGTIWMVVRTTMGRHYRYVSRDGGDSWGELAPMPGFYSSNTMPLLHRLKDGRIVFFWNNTQPLPLPAPENYPELTGNEIWGKGEAAFTNRDAWHAAISEDEGKTWIGFRELRLLDFGCRADFRQYGMSLGHEVDKSVHQSQAIDLEDGRLLLSDGQSPKARRLGIFDPAYLYETNRIEDFGDGLENVSTHLFVKSYCGNTRKLGHCCWNRTNGALLVPDPVDHKAKREVLQLCRIDDPRLVSTLQGATWNFPAAKRGSVRLECFVAGAGFRLSLCDRWMNPSDDTVADFACVSTSIEKGDLGAGGKWSTLEIRWDVDAAKAEIRVGGRAIRTLPCRNGDFAPWGISYLHLQTLAREMDPNGSYFASLSMSKSK